MEVEDLALNIFGSFMYLVKGINQPFGPQSRKSSGTTRTMSHSDDLALMRVRYLSSYWSVATVLFDLDSYFSLRVLRKFWCQGYVSVCLRAARYGQAQRTFG